MAAPRCAGLVPPGGLSHRPAREGLSGARTARGAAAGRWRTAGSPGSRAYGSRARMRRRVGPGRQAPCGHGPRDASPASGHPAGGAGARRGDRVRASACGRPCAGGCSRATCGRAPGGRGGRGGPPCVTGLARRSRSCYRFPVDRAERWAGPHASGSGRVHDRLFTDPGCPASPARPARDAARPACRRAGAGPVARPSRPGRPAVTGAGPQVSSGSMVDKS